MELPTEEPMLSDSAQEELVAALWLYVDAQEQRLVQAMQADPAARRLILEDAYFLLRLGSEPIDDQMARVVNESPLIVLIVDPVFVSQRIAAAQNIARALNARAAATVAVAEIQRSLAP